MKANTEILKRWLKFRFLVSLLKLFVNAEFSYMYIQKAEGHDKDRTVISGTPVISERIEVNSIQFCEFVSILQ
jgi:hypothetical protein